MSNWFDQYYGCNGPCPEYERIVNTPQIYSSTAEDYKSCLPTPKPFDFNLIDNKIKINVGLAKFCPIGVDTMEDYLALKKKLEYNS